ncbi:uncharacterized protein PRCAT00003404001 [Priceomyces carsonii]|uniref:uncharacterized protein n=1 Tax=Priceomyces carsonii TaxID=28549 RepID=UPI002ED7C311|nr:unnamed protein product [Priceomyces carsonii]
MAITRSTSLLTTAKSISNASNSLKIEVKKVTKTTKKPKNISPKKPKVHLEDILGHIKVPKDSSLPQEFVQFHRPEFIKGVKYILEKDPSLYPVIVHRNFVQFKEESSRFPKESESETILKYWYALVSSVISQQISGSAAKSIEQKFRNLFESGKVNPKETLKKSAEDLRSAGLSNQKAKYIFHISEVFCDPNSRLSKPSFYNESLLDEVIKELMLLKGIGEWSAKMFAIFTLNEMDVFAHDDLGVARGMSRYILRRKDVLESAKIELNKIDEIKILLKKKSKFDNTKGNKRDWVPLHDEYVKYIGSKFSPYQTVLMLIMWRLSLTNVEVLENSGTTRNINNGDQN